MPTNTPSGGPVSGSGGLGDPVVPMGGGGARDESPDCSDQSVIALLVGALVASVATAGGLYYMGLIPCGFGLAAALGGIAIVGGLLGGASFAFQAYRRCLGDPDPCPQAATIQAMIDGGIAIAGTVAIGVAGGASGAGALCAVPTVGFLLSLVTSETTALVAAAMLVGLAVMIGVVIQQVAEYEACRRRSLAVDPEVRDAVRQAWPRLARATSRTLVAIGTWPTPEGPRAKALSPRSAHVEVSAALDAVVEASLEAAGAVVEARRPSASDDEGARRRERLRGRLEARAARIAQAILDVSSVAIGSWPTPEQPSLARVARLVQDAIVEAR